MIKFAAQSTKDESLYLSVNWVNDWDDVGIPFLYICWEFDELKFASLYSKEENLIDDLLHCELEGLKKSEYKIVQLEIK